MSSFLRVGLFGLLLSSTTLALQSTQATPAIDARIFQALRWQAVGPHVAGHVTAVGGNPSAPHTFYAAMAGSGVWKTTDDGQTWTPVLDDEPGSSQIAALAVAPAQPETVYVGLEPGVDQGLSSRAGSLARSDNGGRTWTRRGSLLPGRITAIDVDASAPESLVVVTRANANVTPSVTVARSVDAGRTFTVVWRAPDGARLVTFARAASDGTLYVAYVREHAATPAIPETVTAVVIERSHDEGHTWAPFPAALPLPASPTALALAVSPGSSGEIWLGVRQPAGITLFTAGAASADWSARGTLPASPDDEPLFTLTARPGHPDELVMASGSLWRVTDGGRTFARWFAPPAPVTGLWLSPTRPETAIVGTSAGAGLTLNGGASWTMSPGPSTADVVSVVTDTAFPFRVCGLARGAGPFCVSADGASDEFIPVPLAGQDSVTALRPDPLAPEVIFGIFGGHLLRYDRRQNQATFVAPDGLSGRTSNGPTPLVFAPDNRTLYYGAARLWKTSNAGDTWAAISQDWTTGGTRVITALAPSSIAPRTLWMGTSDGQLLLTRDDGTSWTGLTAPAPGAVLSLEASHFDVASAYAVMTGPGETSRLWRTRDNGATWGELHTGLPAGRIHVVREDTLRRGLLFAGTDSGLHVSFDDGDSWQPWRMNLPRVDVRDLTVQDASLVIATGGRGVWVLPDLSALRQATPDVLQTSAFLFRPTTAWRPRAQASSDARAGRHPDEAVSFYYLIGEPAPNVVTLEIIVTATGERIRRFSSDLPEGSPDWLDRRPGLHARPWDLRYAPPPLFATPDQSVEPARGVRVLPGGYQVRLTVDGRPLRQAVTVRLDPRVRLTAAELSAGFALARTIDGRLRLIGEALTRTDLTPERRARLGASGAHLLTLARLAAETDGRPTPSLASAVDGTIAEADAALAP